MIRVGVVSEGMSDFLVLREVMRQVRPDAEFVQLHPDGTMTLLGQGWMGVRAWCIRHGEILETLMVERQVHLLVIYLDCSMADNVEANRPCPPAGATAEALMAVVDEHWLRQVPRHPAVLIAAPAMSTEAWVVATLDSPPVALEAIECDPGVEDQLLKPIWGDIKKLRWRDGGVKKPRAAYEPFAALVGADLDRVLARCSQAAAFHSNFVEAAGRVAPGDEIQAVGPSQ